MKTTKDFMRPTDAARLLNLVGKFTLEDIDRSFKRMAREFHPDIKGDIGTAMMQSLNLARAVLKDNFSSFNDTGEMKGTSYGDKLTEQLNALVKIEGLEVRIAGVWVWINGANDSHKAELVAIGCRHAKQKDQWYINPCADKGRKRNFRGTKSWEHIQATYGSTLIQAKPRTKISA